MKKLLALLAWGLIGSPVTPVMDVVLAGEPPPHSEVNTAPVDWTPVTASVDAPALDVGEFFTQFGKVGCVSLLRYDRFQFSVLQSEVLEFAAVGFVFPYLLQLA